MQLEGTNLEVKTDEEGQFLIQPAPVGLVHLIADGSTAQRPGRWPTLQFEFVTIAGQDNTLGMPIFLLPLSQSELCVTETTGGVLTLPEVPGFSLTVSAGSATFQDGSNSGCISVTLVHADKVPMVPNFGQQPRFIVTIQPAGVLFDPPAPLTIPNLDSLEPGQVTELYSFDHDLGQFVSIGPGTVSDNGMVIASDPGIGVIKAGWHCGGDPAETGTCCQCRDCQTCEGNQCVADTGASGSCDDMDFCTEDTTCQNGSCGGGTRKPDQSTETVELSLNLNEIAGGVGQFMASLEIGGGIGLDGGISLSSTAKCCSAKESFVPTKTGQITLNDAIGPAKFPLPCCALPGFEVLGVISVDPVGVSILLGLEAEISLGVTRDECPEPVSTTWSGSGSIGVAPAGITAGARVTINIPGVDAEAELSVSGTTGLTAAVTVDTEKVTVGLSHKGVKITAKAILMTGGFLPVTLSGELTFQPINPGPIGMFVSPLPQSF